MFTFLTVRFYADGPSDPITRKAAIRMTQRHRWRRQPGNDGTALIFVPEADLMPRQAPSRQTPRQAAGDDAPGGTGFEAMLAVIEAALVEANKRADAAQVLAERTLAELADANTRADAAVTRAEVADGDRRAAEQRAEAERARADVLDGRLADERARADGLGGLLEATQLELAEQRVLTDRTDAARQQAQEAGDELRRADEARKARGRWARLRAAWRR